MRNGWLTTGPQTAAFERAFAAACGVPNTVALNSCTAGLHLSLVALGIGSGDEVVMPALTFVAGAQCTLEVGATPVFCDIEPDTLSPSLTTIERVVTPRTKAIITLSYAGRPLGIAAICAFARERNIAVIEDAAHAAGMLDRGEWAGTRSDAAVFSFYATKNLTTGEGGMLVTSDAALADRVRMLSLHGMSRDAWRRYTDRGSWRYDVLEPGFKYNIPDIASSIGLVQLRRLEALQQRRDAIARRYRSELTGVPGLTFQRGVDNVDDRHSWCMFVIAVDGAEAGIGRDQFIAALRAQNIGTSVHYIPTHHFSGYRGFGAAALEQTNVVADRLVSLPLYPDMSDDDVTDVIAAVHTVVRGEALI
jgi:dTDP-4-amino-4,6-dideoxygalactose transaminase